jgi:hypothetical protein
MTQPSEVNGIPFYRHSKFRRKFLHPSRWLETGKGRQTTNGYIKKLMLVTGMSRALITAYRIKQIFSEFSVKETLKFYAYHHHYD